MSVQSSSSQAFGPHPHVVVEVELVNGCGRDLGPLDVWVRVQGWRQGGLVQEVTGHPFDPLPAGGSQHFGIGLPGSRDWYDEVRVTVEAPAAL